MPNRRTIAAQTTQNRNIAILLAALCVAVIYVIAVSGILLWARWLLAILALLVFGEQIRNRMGYTRVVYGLYLLGGTNGIGKIEALSRVAGWFWKGLADWGMVVGFGFLSLLLFRKNVSKRMFAFGILSILFFMTVVLPNLITSIGFINIPGLGGVQQQHAAVVSLPVTPLQYALYAMSIIGGFFFYLLASIVYGAASILLGIGQFLATAANSNPNYSILTNQIPGAAPIIPGITIPIFSGIIALAIILVVHEFSHGVLARIAGIKVKNVGLLLFGIIPVGAYVEPDEKAILKLGKREQNRIFVAGIASNMLFSVIFLALMLAVMLYALPHYVKTEVVITATVPGSAAYNVIAPGSVVMQWNGQHIGNLSALESVATNDMPNSDVSLVTDKGSFILHTNSTGKIGVLLNQVTRISNDTPISSLVYFLYSLFALTFLLNFFVGIFNLLPLPGLDGWRIFNVSVGNRRIVTLLMVLSVACIAINFLPWVWRI
ncbi:MAG: site-2 protease family protein [Candidatus Micrarchaeota archaeon]|nr:site-2 protease family protein [Candidatus Micrarchaeota archaeon]